MTPAEMFSFIESADLLAFVGAESTSRLIMRWAFSRFSHVALAVWITSPVRRLCVSDAVPGEGVRLVPIESFVSWPGLIEHFRTQDACRSAMIESAFSRWMYAYPTKHQLWRSFGTIIPRLYDWFRVPEDFERLAVHCSEHLAYCCVDAGVRLPKSPQKMSPQAIVDLQHNGSRLFESTGRFSIRERLKRKA